MGGGGSGARRMGSGSGGGGCQLSSSNRFDPSAAWESIAAASAEGSANLQAAMAGMASNFYLHDVATNVRHQNSHQIAGI